MFKIPHSRGEGATGHFVSDTPEYRTPPESSDSAAQCRAPSALTSDLIEPLRWLLECTRVFLLLLQCYYYLWGKSLLFYNLCVYTHLYILRGEVSLCSQFDKLYKLYENNSFRTFITFKSPLKKN